MDKELIGKILRKGAIGLIWVGTHVFILVKGIPPEAMGMHAKINLLGAAIYTLGYQISR
ncbi:MAG: hypothetical protein ACTSRU_17275 [Candidatus Hodarchaeales archaeon]